MTFLLMFLAFNSVPVDPISIYDKSPTEAALLRIMTLPALVSSVRCFASLSRRFFLCCFSPQFFVGFSSNFDITSLMAADIAATMLSWNPSRNYFLSNSLLTTSSDELSSSSSDSLAGAGDFTVGTRCAYLMKKGVSSSLSIICRGDAFTSPGLSVVGSLSVFVQ